MSWRESLQIIILYRLSVHISDTVIKQRQISLDTEVKCSGIILKNT